MTAVRPLPVDRPFRTVFVHVPKCGGQSFELALVSLFPDPSQSVRAYELSDGGTHSEADIARAGPDVVAGKTAVWGHVPHDVLARILPQDQRADWRLVTILRHPVERLASLRSYVLEHPEHPEHDLIRAMSTHDFVRNYGGDNTVCAYVAGATTAAAARAVLEWDYFGWCAIEDLDEFQALFLAAQGTFGFALLPRTNISRSDRVVAAFTAADLAFIAETMVEDIALVTWARAHWRRHLQDNLARDGIVLSEQDIIRARHAWRD